MPGPVTKTQTPGTLLEVRRLFGALDWTEMARQVEEETLAQVAIVGPVNSGKSTLFNTLKGQQISPVAAVPGTTRELHHEQWGPFTLTDTPGFGEVDGVNRAKIALGSLRTANVVILVLDAISGVRHTDWALLQRLNATGKPVVVVLNKIDLLQDDPEMILTDARHRLAEPDLIPISAKRGTNIADLLVPRMIDAHPTLAVAIGRALPAYRRHAANRIIRNAAILNAIIGAEPIPGLDIPFLLAVQGQMVLRIAAIFGEPINAQHARELVATLVGGLTLRLLAQEGAKLIPGPGWLISGAVASAGTWAIGRVAVQYFEHGKKISPARLRHQYRQRAREHREEGLARRHLEEKGKHEHHMAADHV